MAVKAVPQHVKIARENGAKAGFKAYREFLKRSGIDAVQARYQEMLNQGDVPAQYAWYCKEYADQISTKAAAKPATGRRTSGRAAAKAAPATGVTPDLLEQFAAFIASQGATDTEDEVEETEEDIDEALAELDEPAPKRGPGRPKGSPNKPKATPAAEIDAYTPKNPEVNATNGRLWKLNELGLLAILEVPADPITNGEAHEILKANL